MDTENFIHPSASVSSGVSIGEGVKIWQDCQVREGSSIGRGCILGKGVYIDIGVTIGDYCKIQNGVSIYQGVTLEDGVFCGPHCVFTNDLRPRAVNPDGTIQSAADWEVSETLVRQGASIGANSVIVCGVEIGSWAMIGAGSVVTKDVPEHGLVYGNPARLRGFVCKCGASAGSPSKEGDTITMKCTECMRNIGVPQATYDKIVFKE
jgi:acetyltransferase-like isoleucine patch superfamily enzyme